MNNTWLLVYDYRVESYERVVVVVVVAKKRTGKGKGMVKIQALWYLHGIIGKTGGIKKRNSWTFGRLRYFPWPFYSSR